MIAVNRIEYSGLSSLDLDLIVDVAFDSDNGETSTYLNREAIASESYRGKLKRVHNYKYSESFSPKFTFVKNNFEEFSFEEQRKVLKWLTSKDTPSFLTVYYDDSEVITYEILGAFIECDTYKLANNKTVGIQATFESITPYAFSSLYTITKDISDPEDNIITINLETDEPQVAVYPRITIQHNNLTNIIEVNHVMTDTDEWVDGSVYHYNDNYYWVDTEGVKHSSSTNSSNIKTTSVTIKNIHTDYKHNVHVFNTLVKNNIKGETVILDGANRIISSSRTDGRIFGDDFVNWQWIPLYEGKNELSFIGNCTVKIEYRTAIKCGEF